MSQSDFHEHKDLAVTSLGPRVVMWLGVGMSRRCYALRPARLAAAVAIAWASLLLAPAAVCPSGWAQEPLAQILDLACWKLTLPTDRQRPGRADEITQPELATWPGDEHGLATAARDGVVFRAPCGGATTRGSQYPRCELRQMQPGGRQPAAWSTEDAQPHTLDLVAAVTHLPEVKPHVVCAQIHDASDDLLMVRLEGARLLIERPGQRDVVLDEHYVLGRRFTLRIEAGEGLVRVQYEGRMVLTWPVQRKGCYFKAGCYTQSNRQRGDAAAAYGEVVLYQLKLSDCPATMSPCDR